MARVSVLLAAGAACLVLSACGDDPITGGTEGGTAGPLRGAQQTGQQAAQPVTVDTSSPPAPAEVRKRVERTVGAWFRLVRYRAVAQTLGLYTSELQGRLRGSDFEDDLFTYFGPYVAGKRLAVDEVRVAPGDPSRVTAFLRLIARDVPAGETRPADELFLVTLRREGEAWRIADTGFVREQAQSIRRSLERQAAEGAG